MFLVGNNIKRDANKSSKYKTPFEVSDNDNNNKHKNPHSTNKDLFHSTVSVPQH